MSTRAWIAVAAVALALAAAGCKRLEQVGKNLESSWDGLDRTISLYTDDGRLFQRWNAKTDVRARHGTVAFLDSSGKEIKLQGGIVIVTER